MALVFGFGPLALLIANLRAAAFVTLLGGAWLAISSWLLGYATDQAAWVNELVAGVLLMVLCASAAGLHLTSQIRLVKQRARTAAVAETAGSRNA